MGDQWPIMPPARQVRDFLLCTRVRNVYLVGLTIAIIVCSGHDCGVYVMAFIDILSMRTRALPFERAYVWNFRAKCLLSILQGKIAHLPETLQGTWAPIVQTVSLVIHLHHICRTDFEGRCRSKFKGHNVYDNWANSFGAGMCRSCTFVMLCRSWTWYVVVTHICIELWSTDSCHI